MFAVEKRLVCSNVEYETGLVAREKSVGGRKVEKWFVRCEREGVY